MNRLSVFPCVLFFGVAGLPAQDRTVKLPGELHPYQSVDIVARVPGFVEAIAVDRGSVVKKGDVLAKLSAPELVAQKAEASAKVLAIQAQRAEAEAKLAATQSTFARLKEASATPGAVALNEIILAEKSVDAIKAQVGSLDGAIKAALASVQAIEELQTFLTITAPFDGVITERMEHPGALAGLQKGALLRLEQLNPLRLVVAVPEAELSGARPGRRITFTVSAYPGESFSGGIARSARTLDVKTRTMPVEIDVPNGAGRLAPGMYSEVTWTSAKRVEKKE